MYKGVPVFNNDFGVANRAYPLWTQIPLSVRTCFSRVLHWSTLFTSECLWSSVFFFCAAAVGRYSTQRNNRLFGLGTRSVVQKRLADIKLVASPTNEASSIVAKAYCCALCLCRAVPYPNKLSGASLWCSFRAFPGFVALHIAHRRIHSCDCAIITTGVRVFLK